MVANPIRFTPLDGIPDADERGAGTFMFDDGTSMVAEDPELASLIKSYQDTIPEASNLQAGLDAVPDMRTASASDDPIGSVFGADPFGDNAPAEEPAADAASYLNEAKPYEPQYKGYIPAPGAKPASDGGSGAIDVSVPMAAAPAAPSDSQNAAELHRIAAQQALRGNYVQGREAGWQDAQRTGALDPEVAKRQGLEMSEANQGLINSVEQSRLDQADAIRGEALKEAMRLTVQREEQQRLQREAEQKRQRLLAERRQVNDAQIDTSFAQGDSFRQVMAVLGSALLGAVGSDAGLRMIESNIDRHVRKEMQIRGSKLQALAEEIGSEEQAIAGAKAKIYDLLEREARNNQKNLEAAGIENQTPAVLAELKKSMLAQEQGFERESMGKTTEVYQQAVRGGRTGPNLDAAAKHYEAAAKDSAAGKADPKAASAAAELRRLRDTLKRGKQTGALQSVVGWQAKSGLNAAQDFFGGLPPEQREQATTLDELQVGNLMRLVREPNNKRTQDMVQSIGIPRNDRDIDIALQRLDQLIAIEEQGYQTGPQPVEIR